MDFDVFVDKVICELKKQFKDLVDIGIKKVNVNNDVLLTGVYMRTEEEEMIPGVYLEPYFDQYETGAAFEMLVSEISELLKMNAGSVRGIEDIIMDFEQVKDLITYRIVNLEKNKNRLAEIPYVPFLDLAITFHIIVTQEDVGQMVTVVNNKLMDIWKIDSKTLFKHAKENTPRLYPAQMREMMEIIQSISLENTGELIDNLEEILGLPEGRDFMYVLSNEYGLYGACVFLYPGVLDMVTEELGDDIIILPSSVHETLIISYEDGMSLAGMSLLVRDINGTTVDTQDVLSDNAYRYRKSMKRLEMISLQLKS